RRLALGQQRQLGRVRRAALLELGVDGRHALEQRAGADVAAHPLEGVAVFLAGLDAPLGDDALQFPRRVRVVFAKALELLEVGIHLAADALDALVGLEAFQGEQFRRDGVGRGALFRRRPRRSVPGGWSRRAGVAVSRAGAMGLVMWSFMPAAMLFSASRAMARAVMAMMGRVAKRSPPGAAASWRMRRLASRPSITGIWISISTPA